MYLLLKTVVFHSYVSLPEGKFFSSSIQGSWSEFVFSLKHIPQPPSSLEPLESFKNMLFRCEPRFFFKYDGKSPSSELCLRCRKKINYEKSSWSVDYVLSFLGYNLFSGVFAISFSETIGFSSRARLRCQQNTRQKIDRPSLFFGL